VFVGISKTGTLGFVVACVGWLSLSSNVSACEDALRRVEDAGAMAHLQMKPVGSLSLAAKVPGYPLHLVSPMEAPWVWLTNPTRGSDYTVVEKVGVGFGFSSAPVSRFKLLQSDDISLRSLDPLGGTGVFLATFVVPREKSSSAVFKIARIKDSDTGELELVDSVPGLSIDGLKDTIENFVVSTRPETAEFWIADSSRNLRVIEFVGKEGIEVLKSFEIAKTQKIGGKSVRLSGIQKIEFFADARSGYIKVNLEDGRTALVPFFIREPKASRESAETANEASEDAVPSFQRPRFHWEGSVVLDPGQRRSSVHPQKDLIAISHSESVRLYRLDRYAGQLRLVEEMSVKEYLGGYEFVGAQFYEVASSEFVKEGDKIVQEFYDLRPGLILLLRDRSKDETRIQWMTLSSSM